MTSEKDNEKVQTQMRDAIDTVAKILQQNQLSNSNDLAQATGDWISGVRTRDKWSSIPFFHNKPRGYGQFAGSTDGRLRRKLVMAAAVKYAKNAEALRPLREQVEASQTKEDLEISNKNLNKDIADKILNLVKTIPSPQLKRAFYLTAEKLNDPLGYKQKYARLVPFGKDDEGRDKWVKASRRFHTMYPSTGIDLHLPDNTKTSLSPIRSLPTDFPKFGKKELIDDVGQGNGEDTFNGMNECGLLSGAASLPRQAVENMFSWSPSYEKNGVTVRLHESRKRNAPMYIRLNDQIGHDMSAHKAHWPFALSAAVAKAGIDKVREIRKKNGELYNEKTGLPIYTLQDTYRLSMRDVSQLLTGGDLERKEAPVKRATLWKMMQRGIPIGQPARKGVVTMTGMEEVPHAMVWENYDENTGKATFVNPWSQREINLFNKNNPLRKLMKRSNTSDFSNVNNLYFLPKGADPQKDTYVNHTANPWRQRNLLGTLPKINKEDL
jgi:hypothetical protein